MKNVNIKAEWLEILKDFSSEIQGEVLAAVTNYKLQGELPGEMSDAARMGFMFIKREIDKARVRAEAARLRRQRQAEIDSVRGVDVVLTQIGSTPNEVEKVLRIKFQFKDVNRDFDRFNWEKGPWFLAHNLTRKRAKELIALLEKAGAKAVAQRAIFPIKRE